MIYDVSPRISARLAVWPGDVPYRPSITLAQSEGANIDLSSFQATVHLGAHADAPRHYMPTGVGIEARRLEPYLGPCEVIRVDVARGGRIPAQGRTYRAPRVLFRTGSFPDPESFNEDFSALSPELVHELAECGVRLVGIDTPSVDLCHDRELLAHHAIAEHDLSVLEGLTLDHVPSGLYVLVALPLPLEGADASPVRAVLLDQREIQAWGASA